MGERHYGLGELLGLHRIAEEKRMIRSALERIEVLRELNNLSARTSPDVEAFDRKIQEEVDDLRFLLENFKRHVERLPLDQLELVDVERTVQEVARAMDTNDNRFS